MCSGKIMILLIGYFSLAVFTFGSSGAACVSRQVLPYLISHADGPKQKVESSSFLTGLGLAPSGVMPLGAYLVTGRGVASEYLCKKALAPRLVRLRSHAQQGVNCMVNCRQDDRLLIPDLHGLRFLLRSISRWDRWVPLLPCPSLSVGERRANVRCQKR